MDITEKKCIDRFKKINWDAIGTSKDFELHRLLISEYFRRVMQFAKSYEIVNPEPWGVIRNYVSYNCTVSIESEEVISSLSQKCGAYMGCYMQGVLWLYILYEKSRSLGVFSPNDKNIYSPLIILCEINGLFSLMHGMMELGDLSSIAYFQDGWKSYARDKPYLDLDE